MVYLGIEQPVIAAFHPLTYPRFQPGQGLGQDWLA